jgi:hypothetical protein
MNVVRGDEDYQITTTTSIRVMKMMCVITSKGSSHHPVALEILIPLPPIVLQTPFWSHFVINLKIPSPTLELNSANLLPNVVEQCNWDH